MTRGKVLLIGLGVLLLGGAGYVGFEAAGLEGFSAGIAAQAVLVLIVVVWTSSYLFRVVTGQMTYMEQRRRYREVYDEQETQDLEARLRRSPLMSSRHCSARSGWMIRSQRPAHRLFGLSTSMPSGDAESVDVTHRSAFRAAASGRTAGADALSHGR